MAISQPTAIAERSAQTTWTGPLASGEGTVTSGSGALQGLPVTWSARTREPHGMTSPEELAAAAHSSCFAMALALRLGEHVTTPQRLEGTAMVSLDDVDGRPTVVSSDLRVVGQVVDLDGDTFKVIDHPSVRTSELAYRSAGTAALIR